MVIAVPAPKNNHGGWFQRENIETVFVSMQDTCRRFHIDRRRLYLNGHSMGADGVLRFAFAAPKLFAAYAPETLVSKFPEPPSNLTGTAFILINTLGKNSLESAGATVESHKIKSPHTISHEKTKPLMFEFFGQHKNDYLPDLRLHRREILKKVAKSPAKTR